MSRFGEGAEKVPCEGLVELVEAEDRDGAKRYLETLLAGFRLDEVDAVVLGCTHYVFLRDMIKNMIPDHIAITDGNAGTARQLRRVLAERELLNDTGEGSVRILTSGTDADLQRMNRFLQNADT
jgi:glutamate racemase